MFKWHFYSMFPQLSRYSLVYPVMLLGLVAPKLKVTSTRNDEKERISLVSARLVAVNFRVQTDKAYPGVTKSRSSRKGCAGADR
jgi:hypothetical protein